jgi:hypothetical protein
MNEETKPSRIILIIAAAIIIPVVVLGSYVWLNRVPTPYAGQVLSVNIYPIHEDLSQPTSTEGIGGRNDVYDEVLVLADVRIRNVGKIPLFLHDMWAMANFPNESDRSTAASASDFDKVFIAYPNLKQFQKAPLPRDLTIQPGQQVEGQMIFNYQMNQTQWNSRSGEDVYVDFLHQKPLMLHIAK